MPFGINRHSNRSKQALNDTAVQGAATPSSGGSQSELSTASPVFADEARTTQPQAFNQQPRADVQPFTSSQIVPDSDIQQRSGDLPARSQSTRYASAYPPPAQGYGGSADDLTLDSRKYQQQGGAQVSQQPTAEPPKKSKNIFDRMRSGSRSSEQKPPPQAPSYNNTAGLARRLSKRQETPPVIRTVQQRSSIEQQRLDWPAGQDSRSHLPSPQEGSEDDSQLDPYLIREAGSGTPYIALNEGGLQSIRPVQEETESPLHAADEEHRLQFEAHQQHLREQAQQYHSELDSQPYYQQQNPGQPQVNIDSSNLIISDPYRQNPETVSQLSYDSPTEQELRPVSVQSNGQSPTVYSPQRQEYPSRTTSIQNARPISQYSAMAPPSGTQQGRRAGDSKQPLPGNGQGQPEAREGPPPTYTRGQFPPNTQPPTPGLTPTASVVGAQGPNYRGGPPQRDQYGPQGGGDQGRSTPPPAPADRDVNDAYKELCKSKCQDLSRRMLIFRSDEV
jgi:hypothetical protein